MKRHEERKILELLNVLNYTEDEAMKIIDLIDNPNRDERDMDFLLENLNNDLED